MKGVVVIDASLAAESGRDTGCCPHQRCLRLDLIDRLYHPVRAAQVLTHLLHQAIGERAAHIAPALPEGMYGLLGITAKFPVAAVFDRPFKKVVG